MKDDKRPFWFWIRLTGVTFFIVLLLFISGLGIALKTGISLDQFTLKSTTVKNFSLKWDTKLILDVGSVFIERQNHTGSNAINYSIIRKTINYIKFFSTWFSSISVDRITLNGFEAGFKYDENEPGALVINTKDMNLVSSLESEDPFLTFNILQFKTLKYNSSFKGQVRIDLKEKKITAEINARIADCLPVYLKIEADDKGLSFSGYGTEEISTFKPVVDLFQLSHNISKWIIDYHHAETYKLTTVKGSFPYDNPSRLLETLHAEAEVNTVRYSFAQGLEPIKAQNASVVFKKGVLNVYPKGATFYGQDTAKSWVDINFSAKDIVLTAYIKAQVFGNEDILRLLNFYNISLPFMQTSGVTDSDLTLKINLPKEIVNAVGTFRSDNGVFLYDGIHYDVSDALVTLIDSSVDVKKLELSHKDLFTVQITGNLNTFAKKGDLIIGVDSFNMPFNKKPLSLDNSKHPLTLTYHIRKDGDYIDINKTKWNWDNKDITLDKLSMPFDFKQYAGTLPETAFSISSMAEGLVSGQFNLKQTLADLHFNLENFTYGNITLDQKNLPLRYIYNKRSKVSLLKKSNWSTDYGKIEIDPIDITYKNRKLTLADSHIKIPGYFSSRFAGEYDFENTAGSFRLNRLMPEYTKKAPMFTAEEPLIISVKERKGSTRISIPEFKTAFISRDKKGWKITCRDINKFRIFTGYPEMFKLKRGNLTILSENGTTPYTFRGSVTSSYAMIIKDKHLVTHYRFKGRYNKGILSATINDDLNIQISDKINILSKDVGYSLPAIIDFVKNTSRTPAIPENEDSSLELDLIATNSSLFLGNENYALADQLKFQVKNHTTRAQLIHRSGNAEFTMEKDQFILDGQNFDDTFMNTLILQSKFYGGAMNFSAKGPFSQFSGNITITNTILKDYKQMNNILATINTIPALVTFSSPQYHKEGLPVKTLVLNYNYTGDVFKVEKFDIDSRELDIGGTGVVDLFNETLDMDISMITGIKTSISKIPLIGYILVGDKKYPTLSMKLTGNINDPNVEFKLFKKNSKNPFNIFLRTLSLPDYIIKKMKAINEKYKSEHPEEE